MLNTSSLLCFLRYKPVDGGIGCSIREYTMRSDTPEMKHRYGRIGHYEGDISEIVFHSSKDTYIFVAGARS